RVFTCPSCGLTADLDYNASLNTLNRDWNDPHCGASPS
ncbi:zinc ribbon domain-containing protein, partial [Sulfuracidifex metallicus]